MGGGGGSLPGGANFGLGEQMGAAMQMMGLMPQMSDIFSGQGFGSTFTPGGGGGMDGLWGSSSPPAIAGQQSMLDQLMQLAPQPPAAATNKRSLFGDKVATTPEGMFMQHMYDTRKQSYGSRRSQYQAGGRR